MHEELLLTKLQNLLAEMQSAKYSISHFEDIAAKSVFFFLISKKQEFTEQSEFNIYFKQKYSKQSFISYKLYIPNLKLFYL